MKKINILLLIVLVFCFTFGLSYSQVEEGTRVYDFKIFPETEVIMGPLGALYGYFQIMPLSKATGNTHIDIVYTNSEVILSSASFMTLHINGKPLSSIYINAKTPDTAVWRVNIPPEYIIAGYNTILITTLQRTTDDPCKDLYNKANWVRIKNSSNLHLELTLSNPLALYRFPFPYLNYLRDNPINCKIVVPQPYSNEEIEYLMKLVSDWGARVPFRGLNINFSSKIDESPNENRVYISDFSKLKGKITANIPQGNGYLYQTREGNYQQIYITGADKSSISKALYSLLSPNILPQNDESFQFVTRSFPENVEDYNLPKQGLFLLTDLGLPQIYLEGVFTQSKVVVVRRPVRYGAGIESYIKLYFYHSENLDKKQSLLSIYINGVPAGSISLGPENVKGGELVVKIPESELNKPSWVISFVVYHYVGSIEEINCTYDYDNSVWTLIEGKSEIYLAPGGTEVKPSLVDFPNMIGLDEESIKKIYFWLPDNANDELIKIASIISARAGQTLKKRIDPKVVLSNDIDDRFKSDANVLFVIGYPNDLQRWSYFKDKMLVKPTNDNNFIIDPKIETSNETLKNMNIIEAFESPWNANGVVYAILPNNAAGVSNIADALTIPEKISKIDGQVCLISKESEVIPLSTPEKRFIVETVSGPLKNIPLRYLIGGIIVILIIAYLIIRYIRKRSSAKI
ncbi:MAG: cellulose biosynthesis cyclic di-GMP-binding regulatory protein BcsB [Ignavibacteria bacterium]|nr:cellulose biosynthesis cyclic di-GMP-binding regulatory protein BcsB [Ignavibacteria bacterium]